MAKAYTAWRGAIEINVGGFPIPVHVSFMARKTPMKGQSFKLISPDGLPVSQQYIAQQIVPGADGGEPTVQEWRGTIGDCARGYEVAKGDIRPLPPEVLEAIGRSERDEMVAPNCFVPLDSIDLALAGDTYSVVPDDQVAGSAKSASVIWNGLRYAGVAYVTQIVMRAGAIDRIVAIYADHIGLRAVTLPFASELKDEPVEPQFEVNDTAGSMFAQAIDTTYEVKPFDSADYTPHHAERRAEALAKWLEGEAIVTPEPTPEPDAQPDLMAALEAAMNAQQATA
jgi:non-homologous end joining protein Ku